MTEFDLKPTKKNINSLKTPSLTPTKKMYCSVDG